MHTLPCRFEVKSARSTYPVLIGTGLVRSLAEQLDALALGGERLVVSCPPVWRLHGDRLADLSGKEGPSLIPDGERAKNLPTVTRIYEALVKRRFDRSAALVALAGGVAGHVVGFPD